MSGWYEAGIKLGSPSWVATTLTASVVPALQLGRSDAGTRWGEEEGQFARLESRTRGKGGAATARARLECAGVGGVISGDVDSSRLECAGVKTTVRRLECAGVKNIDLDLGGYGGYRDEGMPPGTSRGGMGAVDAEMIMMKIEGWGGEKRYRNSGRPLTVRMGTGHNKRYASAHALHNSQRLDSLEAYPRPNR